MKAQDGWQDSDKHIVGNTCRFEQMAREARDGLPKDERQRPIMTTQGRSENSGEVLHPLARLMLDNYSKFASGLAECGLTPRARKQLELEAKKTSGGGKFDL